MRIVIGPAIGGVGRVIVAQAGPGFTRLPAGALASRGPTSENNGGDGARLDGRHMLSMRVGIPTEVKPDESRVALTPAGVTAFHAAGHEVVVQAGAGLGSALPDGAYERAGATVVSTAAAVWERADLVLKVKEPMEVELGLMRPGQVTQGS